MAGEQQTYMQINSRPIRSCRSCSLGEIRVECNWEGCSPRKGCKMQFEITGGMEGHGDQRVFAGNYVVCSQSCSLIFILQTLLLISPEGSPFPPHTPNPIRNHKRARKVGGEHLNILTSLGCSVALPSSLYFLICVKQRSASKALKTQWKSICSVCSICKHRFSKDKITMLLKKFLLLLCID